MDACTRRKLNMRLEWLTQRAPLRQEYLSPLFILYLSPGQWIVERVERDGRCDALDTELPDLVVREEAEPDLLHRMADHSSIVRHATKWGATAVAAVRPRSTTHCVEHAGTRLTAASTAMGDEQCAINQRSRRSRRHCVPRLIWALGSEG